MLVNDINFVSIITKGHILFAVLIYIIYICLRFKTKPMKYKKILIATALCLQLTMTINSCLIDGFPLWFAIRKLIPNYIIVTGVIAIVYMVLRSLEIEKMNDKSYKGKL